MKNDSQNMGWCRLPFALLADDSLTISDAVVYAVLLDSCINELECICSQSEIARKCGVTDRTVRNAILHLKNNGYLTCEDTGRETIYKLADIVGLKRKATKKEQHTALIEEPEEGQQEIKLLYGIHKTVTLTVMQYEKLTEDFGAEIVKLYVQKCDDYAYEHGKTYADCDYTIRKWIDEDKRQHQKPRGRRSRNVPDVLNEKEQKQMEEYMSLANRFMYEDEESA